MAKENTLLNLPNDILKIIFTYLDDDKEKLRLSIVNKKLRQIFLADYKASEIIKNAFIEDLIKDNMSKKHFHKIVFDIKEAQSKNLIDEDALQVLMPPTIQVRNNFIQKKRSEDWIFRVALKFLPLAIGVFAATAAFLTYSQVYIVHQSFYDGYVPAECSNKPNLSGCQNEVDKYFVNSMIWWALAGGMAGFGAKVIDSILANGLVTLCFPAFGLPDIKNSQLSNRTKHILAKLIKHRDFTILAMGIGLILYLKMSSVMKFNVAKCISEEDYWGLRFDVDCINANVHEKNDLSSIALCAGLFLTYSLFSVMKLCLYIAPKKALETVKEAYKQHGFFGSNQANENTYLLDNMARPPV